MENLVFICVFILDMTSYLFQFCWKNLICIFNSKKSYMKNPLISMLFIWNLYPYKEYRLIYLIHSFFIYIFLNKAYFRPSIWFTGTLSLHCFKNISKQLRINIYWVYIKCKIYDIYFKIELDFLFTHLKLYRQFHMMYKR